MTPSPDPTATTAPTAEGWLADLIDWLFTNPIGQGVLVTVGIAVLAWLIKPIRLWVEGRLKAFWTWLCDLRITRKTTIDRKVKEAVATDRIANAPPPIAVITEEEHDEWRQRESHRIATADRWVISTNGSAPGMYSLQNYAARRATNVRLKAPSGFALSGRKQWDLIEQGDSEGFPGRISSAADFAMWGRSLKVQWTDDHGDEQESNVMVDRTVER